MSITRAAESLLHGGVIAYPTEGVFGLGCLPNDTGALSRLLSIKQRSPSKGLILLASNAAQLDGWISLPDGIHIPAPDPSHPITWIVPASDSLSSTIKGEHSGIAVRVSSNPIAAAICDAVNSPIISTSANLAGEAPAKDSKALRRTFAALVDYIVPGECGPADGPSEIRDLISGQIIRLRHI